VPAEVDRLADLYHLGKRDRETLHVLADAAPKRESPARIADFAQTYLTLERAATEILYYGLSTCPLPANCVPILARLGGAWEHGGDTRGQARRGECQDRHKGRAHPQVRGAGEAMTRRGH
jgi:hypothetical protein